VEAKFIQQGFGKILQVHVLGYTSGLTLLF